jgi:predicted aldo/keto reductase-like oxidoreductase
MSEELIERVAMTQQELIDLLNAAYQAGATDVHEAWSEGTNGSEPDFGEAASDYARQAVELLEFIEVVL